MERLLPRYKWGNIAPATARGVQRGPGYQLYHLVPPDVMEVTVNLGIRDYTEERVEEAIANFWNCVDALAQEEVDSIILGGAPVSAQLGRDRVRSLLGEMEEKTGIHGDAPIEAVTAAMHHLGLRRIAVASRWADELNQKVGRYLEEGGIDVVGITTRNQWAAQAFGMGFEDGLKTALDVGREAAESFPDAEAVWVAGGAAMALHAIPAVEEEFGKPTFTNLSAEVWHDLVHPSVIPPVKNWGKLLATP